MCRRVPPLLLLLAFASCGDDGSSTCQTTSDCAAGQVCLDGYCRPLDGGAGDRDANVDAEVPACDEGAPCATDRRCEVGMTVCEGDVATCLATNAAPAGTVCREAAATCDAEEVCDGVHTTCPDDGVLTSDAVCREASDACDADERCDGASPLCPFDEAAPFGKSCAAGLCNGLGECVVCMQDAPCSGGNPCELGRLDCGGPDPLCLPNGPAGTDTVCRPSRGPCDQEETCAGNSTNCEADDFKSDTTVCREGTDLCDAPETCTGDSPLCPSDELSGFGAICRPGAGDCDVAEMCSGSSAMCPGDTIRPSGTPCRAPAGDCDVAETCTGDSIECPEDGFKPTGVVCRAPLSVCDHEETCAGTEAQCPTDSMEPDGTAMESCPSAPGVQSFWCVAGLCETHICEPMKLDLDQTGSNGCEADGHTIFVTSGTYAANLGGLDGADATCRDLASAASRSGNWTAILSASTANAQARFTVIGPIADTSGRLIANDGADLWDGAIAQSIELDETRTARTHRVWTGTAPNGTKDVLTSYCNNWTGAVGSVQSGRATDIDRSWIALHTSFPGTACTASQAIYCISVP